MKNKQTLKNGKMLCIFALITLSLTVCNNEPNTPPPDTNPPTVAEITIAGLNKGEDGKYTISYNAEIKLGGNAAVSGNSYKWTYTTNPQDNIPNISYVPGDTDASPTVKGFVKGVEYTFTLTATNKNGTDSKSVILKVSQNAAPTAIAATEDGSVTLGKDLIIHLDGSSSKDDDGDIETYKWECVSFVHDKGTVANPYANKEAITEMITAVTGDPSKSTIALRKTGTYKFKLTVTDNEGATGIQEITVTVNPIPAASKNVTVTFPAFGTNPTVINLNPIYEPEGGWGSFSASDIKYTILSFWDNKEYDFTSLGSISLTRDKHFYGVEWPWLPPLFTQVFYYKEINTDKKLGEYSFFAGDFYNEGFFANTYEDTNNNGTFDKADQPITSLPPAPLVLRLEREEITEINEQP